VSIGSTHGSLCRTTLVPLETLDKSNPSGRRNIYMAVRPEEQAKTRHAIVTENTLSSLSSKAPVRLCAKSALSFVSPHV
jgi:hypothetical protein